MKAVIIFATAVLAVRPPSMADAAPARGCTQAMQKINDLAKTITEGANSYWAHRKTFVELKYGPSRLSVPDAEQIAEKEKIEASQLKTAMPKTLASFKALVTTAQSKKCPPPAELSAIAEPAIKLAKRVNFDQFPVDE